MWWGLTPAVDVVSEIPEKDFINVLLVGQWDCRHVLQTISKLYMHPYCKTLKLYIHEPLIENIARSLLFTTLALDDNLGLGAKTSYFLDLYGNTLLRQSTWQYLVEASLRLIRATTNLQFFEQIAPSISLEKLKYKERDQLEKIFKFWSESGDFDILEYWDKRMRTSLSVRYDTREGAFDWDLHMRYRPYGGEPLNNREYKLFRDKGIAFHKDDTDPCVANVTMSSFSLGSAKPAAGYFGDIESGPYPAFSFHCEDLDLLKKVNGIYRKSATEVAERNLERLFYEIEHKARYNPPKETEDNGAIRVDCPEQLKVRRPLWKQVVLGDKYMSIPLPGVDIIFLPTSALKDFANKSQFQNTFDIITIPQNLASRLPSTWTSLCKANCKILVETCRFVISYRKDDLKNAKTELDNFMKDSGCECVGSYDLKKDDFIRYIVKK